MIHHRKQSNESELIPFLTLGVMPYFN